MRDTTTWDIRFNITIQVSQIKCDYHSAIQRCSLYAFSPSEGEQIIIPRTLTSEVLAAIQSVRFIAQHIKDSDRDNEVSGFRNDCRRRMLATHASAYDDFI